VEAFFDSRVTAIREDSVELETPMGAKTLRNDFVFALTGYHPDFDLLESLGVRMDNKDRCPECDPESLESNIPGIYLAGVIVAGSRTNEIFIENGRFHGRQIAADIGVKLADAAVPAMRDE
jgi:thioredoxin reductase (NADPH)